MDIFEECLDSLTGKSITKKNIMQNLQQLVLLIDEMIDEGIVINTNAEDLENKMSMKDVKPNSAKSESSGGSIFGSVIFSNKKKDFKFSEKHFIQINE